MDLSVDIGLGVIDYLMSVFFKAIVGKKLIAVHCRSRLYVLTQMSLNRSLAPVRNHGSADLTMPLQNCGNDSLSEVAAFPHFVAPRRMHVASLAADHGFVGFDF